MLSPLHLLRRVSTAEWKREAYKTRFFSAVGDMASPEYSTWNAEQLVAKVQALEKDLKAANERSDLPSRQGMIMLTIAQIPRNHYTEEC